MVAIPSPQPVMLLAGLVQISPLWGTYPSFGDPVLFVELLGGFFDFIHWSHNTTPCYSVKSGVEQ